MDQNPGHRRTFLIGVGFFSTSVMWAIYKTYVPIFLRIGNPGVKPSTLGFGLSATLIGFIMTLVKIAAAFIQPVAGALSDRTITRLGRRMPYYIALAPSPPVAFALIPLASRMTPPR